jgi:hypothetical protein
MEALITIGMIYVLFKAAGFALSALTSFITGSAKFIALGVLVCVVYVFVQAQGLI